MPNVRALYEHEMQIIRENGFGTKDYGVTRSNDDSIRLLCFGTRDEIWIQKRTVAEEPDTREPDSTDAQILRENGITPDDYGVTFRSSECIGLLNKNTRAIITIWKGDRKW